MNPEVKKKFDNMCSVIEPEQKYRSNTNVSVLVTCIIPYFNVLGVRVDVLCKLETTGQSSLYK